MIATTNYKANAVILKRKNIGEADRLITVFSKEFGKLTILARGVRKISSRRAPHLEIFGHVELVVHASRSWDIVTEAATLSQYPYIRSSLERIHIAYFCCELVNAFLPDKQEHEEIFTLLIQSFEKLNLPAFDEIYILSRNFALHLLRILGYLEDGVTMPPQKLQEYIEQILEKYLRTPPILRTVFKNSFILKQ